MTSASWATIPTPRHANNRVGLRRLCWLAACLLVLAEGRGLAARPADPGDELGRLAQALRQDASAANYQALERFAGEYADSELSAQASFALGMADFEAGRWQRARERFTAAQASRWLGDAAALRTAPKPEVATNISGALTMSAAFPVSGNPVIPTPHSADLLPPLAHALLPPSSRLAPSSP